VEENNLVLEGAPAEEDLIHLAPPLGRRLVAEDVDEHQVGTLRASPGATQSRACGYAAATAPAYR